VALGANQRRSWRNRLLSIGVVGHTGNKGLTLTKFLLGQTFIALAERAVSRISTHLARAIFEVIAKFTGSKKELLWRIILEATLGPNNAKRFLKRPLVGVDSFSAGGHR
jgi:hypothetical protein